MPREFITKKAKETQKLGEILAQELKGGEIICLSGELGSGKTTFAQGLLKGLKVKGPYTSPTFVIMKQYYIAHSIKNSSMFHAIYHLDAYRVNSQDILNLGWEEIIGNPENVVILEWADKVRGIIPKRSLGIEFTWLNENKRKIVFKSKV